MRDLILKAILSYIFISKKPSSDHLQNENKSYKIFQMNISTSQQKRDKSVSFFMVRIEI